ncbi:hypothetical protein K7X08_010265 [Anisodus acutangulus]|uniref:Uncharacterized protein n=1 Tax=Anisodus acutangulus TaxID=402998 RepID=A0A9Q1RU98_9SOLA|nr:hypothetical protein K7X08_010265 [Anisodus acutangulus]
MYLNSLLGIIHRPASRLLVLIRLLWGADGDDDEGQAQEIQRDCIEKGEGKNLQMSTFDEQKISFGGLEIIPHTIETLAFYRMVFLDNALEEYCAVLVLELYAAYEAMINKVKKSSQRIQQNKTFKEVEVRGFKVDISSAARDSPVVTPEDTRGKGKRDEGDELSDEAIERNRARVQSIEKKILQLAVWKSLVENYPTLIPREIVGASSSSVSVGATLPLPLPLLVPKLVGTNVVVDVDVDTIDAS